MRQKNKNTEQINTPKQKDKQKMNGEKNDKLKHSISSEWHVMQSDPPKKNAAVNAVNQYVREFKYNMQNGRAPRWYHTYPLAALGATTGAGLASAPVTTAATMAGGAVGGGAVDLGTKIATGKSWAENMHNLTGLDVEPAAMTNPGMWIGGMSPFATRGSRTLLSAGDQIVKNAAKDVVHYGPVAVLKNPEGWYRPYVDQIRNGWQGWKDMILTQKNGAIRTDINQPYFESFTKRTGKFDGSRRIGDNMIAELYTYPEYIEGIGDGVYARFNRTGKGLFAVTQKSKMPNTYLFHIGGGGNRGFQLSGEHQIALGRMKAAIPKYSYIGETKAPSTGQIGMNFASQKGRNPTLGEMIKASKMSLATEQPLSANSMNMLLSGKNGQLRYTNQYMSNFNEQSLVGSNNVTRELIDNPNLSTINNFILQSNSNARPAFVGLDGKIKMPIPINFKIK